MACFWRGFVTHELPVASYSCELRFYENKLTNCEVFFMNFEVVLWIANLFYDLEIKSRVASYFLRVVSCFLRVANLRKKLRFESFVLWVENLRNIIYELPVAFYKLKV